MHRKSYYIGIVALIMIIAVCTGPAVAYTNYQKIWTSNTVNWGIGGNQNTTYYFPITNTVDINGIHPKVRYLYFSSNMPKGVNATAIRVYSGPKLVYKNQINWIGKGSVGDYTLDMKAYYEMNRGIVTQINVTNRKDTYQFVTNYGAMVKEEW